IRAVDIGYVCRECDHYGKYMNKDFRSAMVPGLLAGQTPLVFWRGEYECAHTSCELPIVVHTSAYPYETNGNVFQRIFSAQPSPTCESGHPLQTEGVHELYLQAIRAFITIPLPSFTRTQFCPVTAS